MPAGEKINRKRLEYLERLRKKNEAKNTKSQLKKLSIIAERKKKKQTRDFLIERLSQYQHTTLISADRPLLGGGSDKRNPVVIEKTDQRSKIKFPKKLRCVSGPIQTTAPRQQQNYCETGSSSSDNEEDDINVLSPPKADVSANAVNVVEMEAIKEEPAEFADELEAKAAKRSRRTDTTKAKLAVGQHAHDEDAEATSGSLQSAKFFRALARIKGKQVEVARLDEVEAQRRKLPIHAEEQQIVEAINEHTVVIICGETGSGKTTQIPQFLYEAGYTSKGHLIGVTEPRRIAAISMAERVGRELCAPQLSSYQIRFEGNRTDKTHLLFMTDGVLLHELQTDVTLSRFSVIIIDEAHERSVYSDVLIGLLSRICVTRAKRGFPLKLVIMSATLRLSDFLQERLFPKIKPKVISVEARQYPVTVHFSRQTPVDYLKAAYRKVCTIHQQLPDGGILVFLSGQREVEQLIQWLSARFPAEASSSGGGKAADQRKKKKPKRKSTNVVDIGEDMVIDYEEFGAADADSHFVDDVVDVQSAMGDGSESDEEFMDKSSQKFPPLHCLPLYSLLSSEKQRRVFEPTPSGKRLCVVATNVAETSLTIPNIRYVVDCGREKRRQFDPITGVSRFVVEWVPRASADQRSGRAGRVQAGHAYRLYSSAVYEDFTKFALPDILNQSIEQLVLHLKAMNFTKILNFPFPTPPAADQVEAAEGRLLHLGALSKDSADATTRITPLGRTLAQIPLLPPFAYVLAQSNCDSLLPYAIAIVATLSVREPLISVVELRRDTEAATQNAMADMLRQRRAWCALGEARHLGDLCVLLHLIGAADNEPKLTAKFLSDLGLRPKTFFEIRRFRRQLVNVVNESSTLVEKLDVEHKLELPTQNQMRLLREIMTASLPEQIAKRVDRTADDATVPKGAYKCQRLEEFVFIDFTSVLYNDQPNFLLYQEIVQLGQKKCMQNVASVEEEWVPEFVKAKLKNS